MTGEAAEALGRKWIAVESELEYVIGSALALHARQTRRRRGGIHARGPTHTSLGHRPRTNGPVKMQRANGPVHSPTVRRLTNHPGAQTHRLPHSTRYLPQGKLN